MNIKKGIVILLAIVFACVSIIFIIQTYAKYMSSAEGTANALIARWNIKVNTLSIKNNTDISAKIEPVFVPNEHIAQNVIAPTSEGYFDLEMDFTEVDVSFVYEITFSVNELSIVDDFIAVEYSVDGGSPIPFGEGEKIITEQVNLDDVNRTRTIRVYIMWDSEDSTLQNIKDTAATKQVGQALIDVKISFKQVISVPVNEIGNEIP